MITKRKASIWWMWTFTLTILTMLAVSCNDVASPGDNPEPSLTLSPERFDTFVGGSSQLFTAVLTNSSETITWSLNGAGTIAETTGATASYTPLTAGGAATATLTASAGSLTATATIKIAAVSSRADYNAFNRQQGLNDWDAFSPVQADEEGETGEEATTFSETIDKTEYDCRVTPYSLTTTPEKIVTFSPDADKLFPGALLQGKGHILGLGSLNELPIRQRAPLTISIDLLTSDNTRTIENPTNATVQQAIGDLISKAEAEGLKAGSDIFFNQKETHSVEQVALSLDVSARYNAFSGSGSFDFDRSVDETTVTAYYVQNMFTVSITQPQTPADWFSEAFTQEVLAQQVSLGTIGPDNLPVYVSSVTFGRVLMFNFTSKGTEQDIRATLTAAYDGVAGEAAANLTTEQKKLLQEAEIQVVTIGGEGKNASAIIRSGNLKDYFGSEAALTSAKPISFIMNNVGDNSIAKVSETTEYNITECTASPVEAEVIGERVRVSLIDVYFIDAGDGSDGDIYGWFRLNKELAWEISSASTRTVASGSTIVFATDAATKPGKTNVAFNCLYDAATKCSFEVQGLLMDDDNAPNPDDTVGSFPYAPPYPFVYETKPIPWDGRAGDNGASTLNIKVEKICDLIEGDGNGCGSQP